MKELLKELYKNGVKMEVVNECDTHVRFIKNGYVRSFPCPPEMISCGIEQYILDQLRVFLYEFERLG